VSKHELPPDPDGKNDKRAEWAGMCILLMHMLSGADNGVESLGVLVTYMFHWCDRSGYDMDKVFRRSRDMYRQETTDPMVDQ
jgi:hypothetical protein